MAEDGTLERRVEMPGALRSVARRHGFEGVAAMGGRVWIAVKRGWEDDPDGLVKLLAWSPGTEGWGVVHYPLDEAEGEGWVGLSDLATEGPSRWWGRGRAG